MMTIAPFPQPDRVSLQFEPDGAFVLARHAGETWRTGGAVVSMRDGLVELESASAVSRIVLRWRRGVAEGSRILGDAWERSYGDLGWTGIRPERALPWYWVAHDPATGQSRGGGVRTQPAAWCSWTVDVDGVTLWLDVRSGTNALELGSRRMRVAEVLRMERSEGPSGGGADPGDSAAGAHNGAVGRALDAFAALGELVAALAPPPLPVGPLVGSNNWYYAYGHGFDADAVVGDARTVVALAAGHPVAPFGVIDAGWGEGGGPCDGGPFERGKRSFSDMRRVADRIRAEGARPGLWYRPLLTREPSSPLAHPQRLDDGHPLDPSLPAVLERVNDDLRRFAEWGYDLVKHDFSTFDITGAFAPHFGARMGSGEFSFADRSRSTAEIMVDFYRTVADAAAVDATVVLGCNTVGHLAAGLVAVNRTGDDTSGRRWERTRRMGVNTLAFRLPQHGRFFALDADCVPVTPETPWVLNRQFLDLVAHSGTALFLSIDPASVSRAVRDDLERAVAVALDGGAPDGVEPLDHMATTAPRRWRVGTREVKYDWSDELGAEPFVHGT